MSYYLRVIDRKDNTDICSIHSTLSDAIDALSKVEIGSFVSLTTKRPRINKCLSCVTRKAHDYLLDDNIRLREALEFYTYDEDGGDIAREALKGGKKKERDSEQ